MNWIWYVLLLQALLAFFVSGGLYYRHSSFKNRSVSILMLLFGCHILIYIAGATGFTTLYPSFYLWFYFEVAEKQSVPLKTEVYFPFEDKASVSLDFSPPHSCSDFQVSNSFVSFLVNYDSVRQGNVVKVSITRRNN